MEKTAMIAVPIEVKMVVRNGCLTLRARGRGRNVYDGWA
jgi:hypothetical protein